MAARAAGTRTSARQSRPVGPPPRSAAEAAALRGVPPSWEQQDGGDEAMDPGVHAFEPVRLPARTEESAAQAEARVPLFYVGDVAYTVPARPGMEYGLNALHITRQAIEQGADMQTAEALAMDYVFEVMLGGDGYAALRRYRKLDPEAFAKITAIAHRLTIGALELPKDAASG